MKKGLQSHRKWRLCCISALLLWAGVPGLAGQDLEPRAYSASPVGVTFVGTAFSRSRGGVLADPSLPLRDIKATVYATTLGLGYTFPVLHRQALLTALLPYAWGTVSGNVGEQRASVDRSGLANARFRFSVNLHGSPALTPKEFAGRKDAYVLAVSLTADAPTGQYSGARLINLGTNRWAFKPEIGISYPVKKFYLDLYGGVWFFTANKNFFPGGLTRTQDRLPVLQGHIIYSLPARMWFAVDATWYRGGAGHINGGPATLAQNNTRVGATFSLPVGPSQSLKIAYSLGARTKAGSNFRTIAIAWQYTHVPK
ncbi:MAG TPA: transporter [Candidatus Limnocylindrales bacterium]|nr:transporter [Candidatus Limnocylindrales bacterium]